MEARERGLSPSCELRVWRERSQSQTRSLARTAVLLSEDWPRAVATAWAGCWVSSSHYSPLPGQDGWHRHAPHTHSLAPHLSYESVSCYLLNAIWPEMMETKDAKYDIINWFLHYITNMTCYLKRAIESVFIPSDRSFSIINWLIRKTDGESVFSAERIAINIKLGLSSF